MEYNHIIIPSNNCFPRKFPRVLQAFQKKMLELLLAFERE